MTDSIQPSPFDTLDYQIIQELRRNTRRNARIDAAKIARVVGANERTVRKRIDRLLTLGAIRITAIVDPRAFGYVTALNVSIEVEAEHAEEVVKRFLTMQEIAYVSYGLGDQDILDDQDILLIQAYFKDNDEMREFLKHTLSSIPGIKVISYTLVPRVLRSIDEWMPRPEDFQTKPEEEDETGG